MLVVSGYSPGDRLRENIKSEQVSFMARPYPVPDQLSSVRERIDEQAIDSQEQGGGKE